jgi:hypothetical protein
MSSKITSEKTPEMEIIPRWERSEFINFVYPPAAVSQPSEAQPNSPRFMSPDINLFPMKSLAFAETFVEPVIKPSNAATEKSAFSANTRLAAAKGDRPLSLQPPVARHRRYR